MSASRRIALALGFAAAALGAAALLAPGIVGDPDLPSAVVALVGLLALAGVGPVVREWLGAERESVRTPDPERRFPHPAPGDAFDDRLAALSVSGRRRPTRNRAAVRTRLEDAASAALARREGRTDAAAREQLHRGTWTEDCHAAAFFAEPIVPTLSTGERLRTLATGEPAFRRRAHSAVDALSRRVASEGRR